LWGWLRRRAGRVGRFVPSKRLRARPGGWFAGCGEGHLNAGGEVAMSAVGGVGSWWRGQMSATSEAQDGRLALVLLPTSR
jgi:hypothetical protein